MIANINYQAKIDTGFAVAFDGLPLTIALISPSGKIMAHGGEVSAKLFNLAVETHEQFWRGDGHLNSIGAET